MNKGIFSFHFLHWSHSCLDLSVRLLWKEGDVQLALFVLETFTECPTCVGRAGVQMPGKQQWVNRQIAARREPTQGPPSGPTGARLEMLQTHASLPRTPGCSPAPTVHTIAAEANSACPSISGQNPPHSSWTVNTHAAFSKLRMLSTITIKIRLKIKHKTLFRPKQILKSHFLESHLTHSPIVGWSKTQRNLPKKH